MSKPLLRMSILDLPHKGSSTKKVAKPPTATAPIRRGFGPAESVGPQKLGGLCSLGKSTDRKKPSLLESLAEQAKGVKLLDEGVEVSKRTVPDGGTDTDVPETDVPETEDQCEDKKNLQMSWADQSENCAEEDVSLAKKGTRWGDASKPKSMQQIMEEQNKESEKDREEKARKERERQDQQEYTNFYNYASGYSGKEYGGKYGSYSKESNGKGFGYYQDPELEKDAADLDMNWRRGEGASKSAE